MEAFSNVIGHSRIRDHLYSALISRRISHAYLFEGMAGIGRTTMALEWIRALLCTEPQADHMACGRCLSCITLKSGNHPDVIWIDRGDKSTIGVDVIRDRLTGTVRIPPYSSRYKIYVIREAQTLTVGAQNALLKTLEEPPEYVLIIMIASSGEAFLPTVLSRVIRLRFQPLTQEQITGALLREKGISKEKAALIAALSQGSLGLAKELALSEEFAGMREELARFLGLLGSGSEAEFLRQADLFERYKDRKDQLFDLMLIWIRDLLVGQETQDPNSLMTQDQKEAIFSQSQECRRAGLLRMFSAVLNIQEAIRQGAQYAFAVDHLLMQLAQ